MALGPAKLGRHTRPEILRGPQKRKKKKLEEEKVKADKGRILKFFSKLPQSSSSNVDEDNVDVNVGEDNVGVNVDEANLGEDVTGEDDVNVNVDEANVGEHDANVNPSVDIFDPRNWDKLNLNLINELVMKNPKRDLTIDKGPVDNVGRRFSKFMYNRILSNRETCDREWLVYSKELDKEFCFCCKLFRKGYKKDGLDNEGYSDWKHASQGLKDHEVSFEHLKHMHQWFECVKGWIAMKQLTKKHMSISKKKKIIGKKWQILNDNVKGLTLKSLSVTRWESRVNSIKTIRTQLVEVRKSLKEVSDSDKDPKIQIETRSLEKHEVGDYEFLVQIVIWYEILSNVNVVSKKLQSKDVVLDVAIDEVDKLIKYFKNYREVGFSKAIDEATEIANELGINAEFPEKQTV
ncbi:zinc finger MYM-type protein 5-like [Helianthus annuus]|uniref:zinc finger MYM-type protein 5-like n=1 Tax=Helianthus annuus TaxID=4232 RepID=UPI000B8F9AD0|nr:zinc finger MYM-type protein 5-like [Helianthus annuus]